VKVVIYELAAFLCDKKTGERLVLLSLHHFIRSYPAFRVSSFSSTCWLAFFLPSVIYSYYRPLPGLSIHERNIQKSMLNYICNSKR